MELLEKIFNCRDHLSSEESRKIFECIAESEWKFFYTEAKLINSKIEDMLEKGELTDIFRNWEELLCSEELKNLQIHIRIMNCYNDVQFMHFVGLFIYKLKLLNKDFDNQFSVFFCPEFYDSNNYISDRKEAYDNNTYDLCSSYFRCLAQETNNFMFGVNYRYGLQTINTVSALEFRNINKVKDQFPMIIFNGNINRNTMNCSFEYVNANKIGNEDERFELLKNKDDNKFIINNYELLFNCEVTDGNNVIHIIDKYIDAACQLRKNGRFGFANCNKPVVSITDYIFETAIYVLRDKLYECEGSTINDYAELLKVCFHNSNILSFAIFALIFSTKGKIYIKDDIKNTSIISNEIGENIKQIIQNSLQHSTSKISIISFYLEDEKLSICVSDFSNKGITKCFKDMLNSESIMGEVFDNISNEMNNRFITNIFNNKDKVPKDKSITLDCLFNDFTNADENQINDWRNYRSIDSSAHIGMTLFSNAVKRCSGNFCVLSTDKYVINNATTDNVYFSKNENDINAFNSEDEMLRCSFPGTSYYIKLPTNQTRMQKSYSISRITNKYFVENYATYNAYLDYEEIELTQVSIDLKNKINAFISKLNKEGTINSESKYKYLSVWTNYWLKLLEGIKTTYGEKTYYILDFKKIIKENYLTAEFQNEVFAKGLINAIGVFFTDKSETADKVFFAIHNCSKKFVNIFIQITTQIPMKEFPNGLQLFLVDSNNTVQVHLFGDSYYSAIRNSYVVSLENGSEGYDASDFRIAGDIISNFNMEYSDNIKYDLFPFECLVPFDKDRKIFFNTINKLAEKELIKGRGYKLLNNHIRIGNKVHMNSFYEMSFLFYRTIVANNVAFYILKDMIKNKVVDFDNDYVLFYGYSAYSQAILTSLTNIANLRFNNNRIFYATYIYNSQSDENSEEIDVHINDRFSFDKIEKTSKIKIIQIVPISSTLTTFSKMWSKIIINQGDKKLDLVKNYTVFWVRDTEKDSDLEQKYYGSPNEDYVETKFKNLPQKEIYYILNGNSVWNKPETCKECFPKNVIDEIPLIETDQTSTVPSQQLYLNQDLHQTDNTDKDELKRLTTLLGFVNYGHFYRGKNHFQYYIDTQSYFDYVSGDVREWLEKLSGRDKERLIADYPCIEIIFSPVHNSNVGFSQYVNSYYFNGCAEIISVDEDKVFRSNFICEHNEIKLLIERLTNDYYKYGDETFKPVRFTFVDDNLITGETFRKASSLLQSLIPEKILKNYTTNLFDRCFVLINRLSASSIKSYIVNELDYNAFCHIDVSNMRTHGDSCVGCKLQQQANRFYKRSSTKFAADYWYKKSIVYENEFCNSHDDNNKKCKSYMRLLLSHTFKNYINIQQNEEVNFFKLVYTYFEVFLLKKFDIKSIKALGISEPYVRILFDSIHLIMPMIAKNDEDGFYNVQNELAEHYFEFADRKNIICNLIKIISRPFFIYNQRLKRAILKFMIIIAECVIKNSLSLSGTDNLKAYDIAKKIIDLFEEDNEKLCFLKDYIYEALSDLNSTYLLRKITIISTLKYVNDNGADISLKEDFFRMYSIFIQKVVDSGSDETRALRLEHLLVNGKDEYSDLIADIPQRTAENRKTFSEFILSEVSKENINENVIQIFKNFCNEIFLLNGVILYDGVKQMYELNGITEDYFMERWINLRKIDNNYHGDEYENYSEETKLNSFLSNSNNDVICDEGVNIINKRYNDLINLLVNAINQKYKIDKSKIHIALLTYHKSFDNDDDIRDFEFVISNFDKIDIKNDLISAHNKSKAISNYKYVVKNEIIKALNNHNNFRNYGYYIGKYEENELKKNCCISYLFDALKSNSYCIIDFDNNIEDEKIKQKIKRIVPVYLYFSFNDNSDETLPYMLMRDILSYRNSLIYYFQKDFTSDVMQRYNRFLDTSIILENERVVSHTSHKKDYDEVTSLINETEKVYCAHYDSIKNWVLARNYCNSVIARLYNRVFNNIIKTFDEVVSDSKNKTKDYTYKLYLDVNYEDGRNVAFKKLSQINPFENDDPFFKLFREIIVLQKKENNCISTEEWFNDDFDIFVESHNEKQYGYNLEFVKNIIYRICLDALRYNIYSYSSNDFIDLINKYYCHKDNMSKKESIESNLLRESSGLYDFDDRICIVEFCVEECPQSTTFDWLVIRNKVDRYSIDQNKMKLEYFKMKMKDPLDFSDGHMSLLAAKEYFLKLHKECEKIIVDNIYSYEDDSFVTRLPIIRKGVNFNGNKS
ncbi:MAG: hypothetical protein NC213_00080 [Acetobacter sp.]|nr:hypothetical protein [Bacteroides sp.]MCM1340122.1 hypothetical protein [Acetobacter sp.]MCM1432704.1 hypothetical protein [Clostridiales bacterium]